MQYLILGAGPAGLTIANVLKRRHKSFLLLEKEKEAGGLCRSVTVDGYPVDTGGGHFLDTRSEPVVKFLFEFMPEHEWNTYERNSQIYLHGQYTSHPLEANIWQFPQEIQNEYLLSIKNAGCNKKEPVPGIFTDWIYWKFGEKIARDYMLPYNRKMFAEDVSHLGTYWLEKLPDVSYEETLRSCREKKPYGKQPGHAVFYYPKTCGYGEVWLRMAEEVKQYVRYEKEVKHVDMMTRTVVTADGARYTSDCIINTIPWDCFTMDEISTSILQNAVSLLKHNSVEIRYFEENIDSKAHWIYYPQKELPYHRRLLRNNFALGSRGHWTETRLERTYQFQETGKFQYVNEYAYPLNTTGKLQAVKKILNYALSHQIAGIGRWGEHRHYNSDVVVEKALKLGEVL